MNIHKFVLLVVLLVKSSSLLAATAYRIATVDEVQTDSSTRTGYENIMYVLQPGSWLGSQSCLSSYAYFNAKDNPHFVATILAARISEKPLKIYVDDTLPRISGFCQVINVSL